MKNRDANNCFIFVYCIMNQVQLFFLLFLTRAYIPLDVKTVITGNTAALNLPKFFSFERIEIYSSALDEFNFDLTNHEFDPLEVQSNSTIYNISPTILFGALVILLHLYVLLLNKILSKIESAGKWSYPLKVFKWVANKAFCVLTFGYYIRYIFEMNQFILISSVYEIFNLKLSQPLEIVSFIFALLILVACIALILFVLFLSFSKYEVVEGKHNKLGEIFSGVKMQKKHKFFVVALLIRRALFVVLLITLESVPSRALIGVLSSLQLGYLVLLSFIRPFDEVKCNIIEIMNEVYFLALLSSLIYLNTEENWSQTITNFYMLFLTSNTIMTFLIIFGKFKSE